MNKTRAISSSSSFLVSAAIRGIYFGAGDAASFWKRGSFVSARRRNPVAATTGYEFPKLHQSAADTAASTELRAARSRFTN